MQLVQAPQLAGHRDAQAADLGLVLRREHRRVGGQRRLLPEVQEQVRGGVAAAGRVTPALPAIGEQRVAAAADAGVEKVDHADAQRQRDRGVRGGGVRERLQHAVQREVVAELQVRRERVVAADFEQAAVRFLARVAVQRVDVDVVEGQGRGEVYPGERCARFTRGEGCEGVLGGTECSGQQCQGE